MNYQNDSTLSCRFCQHYQVEGRRGGLCHRLNVPVQGSWQFCPVATRPFVKQPISIEIVSQASYLSVNNEKVIRHYAANK